MMKKVLIITYYWPPSGGSGVQRWLKFTKYLPEFGWQPYVFTPENPSFEVKDQSLVEDISPEVEVIKLPIWEPYTLFEFFKPKGNQQSDIVKKKKKSFFAKLMLWVRGNIFIPDPRMFWVRPSVKILKDLLESNNIDTIITTGPPHSMHLIGLKLKKAMGVKWLADFRDPWSQWGLFDNFYLTFFARKRHAKLEQKVLEQADEVFTVSDHYAQGLQELVNREIHIITNGYDDEEFEISESDDRPDKFIIRHIGVVDEYRDPRPVLRAIEQLAQEGEEFPLEFVGNVNLSLKEEIQSNKILSQLVSFKAYVPHSEVLSLYRQSAVLLSLPMNAVNSKGNIPGKIFEYLAANRPILAISSVDDDSARIVQHAEAGMVVPPDNVSAIKKAMLALKGDFEQGVVRDNRNIEAYTRKNLTRKLAQLLDKL